MKVVSLFIDRFRSLDFLGHFLFALFIAATINFYDVFLLVLRRTNGDGYMVSACYYAPPPAYLPRLLVAVSLLIAAVGVFLRSFPRNIWSLLGLVGALSAYGLWWSNSYRVFLSLSAAEIDFLNNIEIRHVAYLYGGAWLDVGVAVSTFVALVLIAERFLTREQRADSGVEHVDFS
jgi:hypothetical protein